jgi:tetratricopeptide (TPR) repeat protein
LDLKSIIKELKRRNVFKTALAYLAVAWILLQVFSILLPMADSPKWVLKTITIIMFIGFPFWLLFSWSYQITSDGLRKFENINNDDSKNARIIYGLFFLLVIAPIVFLVLKPAKEKTKVENSTKNIKVKDSRSEHNGLTRNLIALDFYKRGEFYHKKQSLADINLAIENYQKAIENDSLFAMAYNNLGSAYMRKNLSFDPNTKWEEEAYAAAGKALQLDPNLANPHIIQGQFYWSPSHNFAHKEAIDEFEKAILKDSTISQAYEQLSLVQLHIGLFDKALKNAQKSVSLDPSNYRAKRFIGEIFLFQGNYDGALKEFNKIPESFAPQPTQAFKALTYFYLNQTEKAIELLKENLINYPNSPHINSVYAIILSSKGEKNMALKKMDLAQKNTNDYIHAHHIYYYLGIASALMNENQIAIRWFEKAANSGFPNYPLYKSDPNLNNLNKDQEFVNFLSRLKSDWEYYNTF